MTMQVSAQTMPKVRVSVRRIVQQLEHTTDMLDAHRRMWGRFGEELRWDRSIAWPSKRAIAQHAEELKAYRADVNRDVAAVLEALRLFYPHALDIDAKEEA